MPQSVSHPGETLAEKLVEINMSQKEFAVRSDKPEQTIVKIINGESSITPDMAVQFENVLKIPAHFWLNRQQNYDIAVARNKRETIIEEAKNWADCFPYSNMSRAGWVSPTRLPEEKAKYLLDFFAISNHDSWDNMYLKQELKVSFRISLAHTKEAHAISAWLRQGEIQAKEIVAPAYDSKKFKTNLQAIKSLMAEHPTDYFQRLQRFCLEAGVIVVYTPCLPKAPIHGSTRWIVDTPLIQLTARYKQNDRFWFTFFHEVGHILLHGKKYISLENIEYSDIDIEKEREADDFAINWTFSKEQEQEVLKIAPLTEGAILEFAKKFNTHPALIIGRLHHIQKLPYNRGRQFMMPINIGE
jgi:HTH-type transcriptional regulator / antitoxin HigA